MIRKIDTIIKLNFGSQIGNFVHLIKMSQIGLDRCWLENRLIKKSLSLIMSMGEGIDLSNCWVFLFLMLNFKVPR